MSQVNIRSVTLFAEPDLNPSTMATFFNQAQSVMPRPVQTVRLATTPFPDWLRLNAPQSYQVGDKIQPWLEAGAQFVSLGPVLLRHEANWLDRIPEIIAENEAIFLAAEIADTRGDVDTGRCLVLASIIRRLSSLKRDGSANLQFSALANCRPGTPFFPTAYHAGGPPQFAIAVEAAGLIFQAIDGATSLVETRRAIIEAIEREAEDISSAARELAVDHQLTYGGIDFSLAPFPDSKSSLAGAMEKLGLAHIGVPGATYAAAFLADAIGRADFQRCGFSGLFFPVLEDSVLATRAGAGLISVSDLLGYSAVCGTGLDTIPLAGDASLSSLTGILLDIGAMASRLNKPLTARLMPIPGAAAGDPVNIDFPWFAPSGAMALAPHGVSGHLSEPVRLHFNAYHQK